MNYSDADLNPHRGRSIAELYRTVSDREMVNLLSLALLVPPIRLS